MLGLTVLSDVLVIADAVIEERLFLLWSMSPLLAHRVISLRYGIWLLSGHSGHRSVAPIKLDL